MASHNEDRGVNSAVGIGQSLAKKGHDVYYLEARDRLAIVQRQLYLVLLVVAWQFFLLTQAFDELLSDRREHLLWITLISLASFLLTFVVGLWSRRTRLCD